MQYSKAFQLAVATEDLVNQFNGARKSNLTASELCPRLPHQREGSNSSIGNLRVKEQAHCY